MKCKNCGAEIPDNVSECPYCDSKVMIAKPQSAAVTAETKVTEQPEKPAVQQKEQSEAPGSKPIIDPEITKLIGKQYTFKSALRTYPSGTSSPKFISNITIAEDKLLIVASSYEFNESYEIMFEDITGIDNESGSNIFVSFVALILFLGGFFLPVLFIFLIILAVLSLTKVTISQKNGTKDIVYFRNPFTSCGEFVNDMKKITKIK